MKLALRPRLLPPALEWRGTRLYVTAGLSMTLGAGLTALLHVNPVLPLVFATSAASLFALAYRGRAEHLERLSLQLIADRENARRLEVVGLATTGFAHELKNSLTVLKGFAELAKRSDPDLAKERIAAVDAQAERLVIELKQFLVLARNDRQQQERPLQSVLREVQILVKPLAELRERRFDCEWPEGLTRPVRDPDLRRALLNLALNALQSARTKLSLSVTVEGEEIVIRVEDDGPGVDPSMRPLLFTPFASGRADGTGLGLAQVLDAATREGGTAEYAPLSPGAGFTVRFPATVSSPTSEPPVA